MLRVIAVAFLAVLATSATARDPAQVRAFKRANPCPETNAARGPCPGWVVDHVVPLCAGGPDRPANMQWQTAKDAKRKDVEEHRECRALRASGA